MRSDCCGEAYKEGKKAVGAIESKQAKKGCGAIVKGQALGRFQVVGW